MTGRKRGAAPRIAAHGSRSSPTTAATTIIFQSGVVADNTWIRRTKPTVLGLWDRTFKDDGTPAHFFWDVATETSQLLRPPVTLDKNSPAFDHSTTISFPVGALTASIDHITARIRIRPLSYAYFDERPRGDRVTSPRGRSTSSRRSTSWGPSRTWNAATSRRTGAAMNTGCTPALTFRRRRRRGPTPSASTPGRDTKDTVPIKSL